MSQTEYCQSIVNEYRATIGQSLDRKFRKVNTPMCQESLKDMASSSQPGEHASDAAKWVGKLLYLCRMTRADLQTAVCRLSRHIANWTIYADAILHRIIQYLDHFGEWGLSFIIEKNVDFALNLYVDADHSGDPTTSKSTTGWIMKLGNKLEDSTDCTISWCSKRQQATAWSSGGSEMVAMSGATRPALKVQLLLHGVRGGHELQEGEGLDVVPFVWCDANAAILAIRKGYPSMEYAEKTQRVRIGALHDGLTTTKGVNLDKIDTLKNTADCMAKPLDYGLFNIHRMGMRAICIAHIKR